MATCSVALTERCSRAISSSRRTSSESWRRLVQMSDARHLLNAWVTTPSGDKGQIVDVFRDSNGHLVRVRYLNRSGGGWFDPEMLPDIKTEPPSNVVTSVQ